MHLCLLSTLAFASASLLHRSNYFTLHILHIEQVQRLWPPFKDFKFFFYDKARLHTIVCTMNINRFSSNCLVLMFDINISKESKKFNIFSFFFLIPNYNYYHIFFQIMIYKLKINNKSSCSSFILGVRIYIYFKNG